MNSFILTSAIFSLLLALTLLVCPSAAISFEDAPHDEVVAPSGRDGVRNRRTSGKGGYHDYDLVLYSKVIFDDKAMTAETTPFFDEFEGSGVADLTNQIGLAYIISIDVIDDDSTTKLFDYSFKFVFDTGDMLVFTGIIDHDNFDADTSAVFAITGGTEHFIGAKGEVVLDLEDAISNNNVIIAFNFDFH